MVTDSATTDDTRAQLTALISRWEMRRRVQRIVLYLPRVLIAAFVVGIVTSLVIGLLRLTFAPQLLVLTGIAVTVTVITLLAGLGLFGNQGMAAARFFDREFALRERLATAFELIDGRIHTVPELAQRQLDDTYARVREIDPAKWLRIRVNWLEWAGAFSMLMVLVVAVALMALNTGFGAGTGLDAGTQAAIGAAADDTRDITEELATDSGLTDEERTALLESTERTLAELENPESSAAEAFAAMSQLESNLNQQADAIENEAASQQAGLQAAAEALEQAGLSNSSSNQLAESLEELGESLDQATPEQQRELAERLARAAQAAQQSNPQLGQQLGEAQQALQRSDAQAALQALQEAAQQAESAAQQAQQRSESADALREAAQQAQAGSQQIARADSNNTAQQDGQAEAQTALEQQLQEQAPDVPGADQQTGGGDGEQSGEGETGSLAQSDQEGAQTAEGGQGGEGSEDSGEQQGAGESDEGGEGGGAGDGTADQRTQGITSTGEDGGSQNSPDGEGESPFEQIFTPQQQPQNSISTTTLELEASAEGAPGIEGEFQQNPDGTSSVPYNQVFRTYADAANRALESEYVPLGVRDVVRDYFTSIEPTGDE